MPLIVISGQPSSGKSTVAARLRDMCASVAPGTEVVVIDDDSLHIARNTAYSTTRDEKDTRGHIRATVDRLLTKRNVVILDSLNNIKGYRYELYCIARAAAVRYCMVHVDTEVDTCRAWNAARDQRLQYSPEVFEDLAGRFERPDGRNRWDSPLFTVRPDQPAFEGSTDPVERVLSDVVHAMLDSRPGGAAADAARPPGSEAGPGGEAPEAAPSVRALTPNLATVQPNRSGTNLLHDVDRAAQEVINIISDAQGTSGVGGPIQIPGCGPLQLSRIVTIAELRRHKRNFLKLTATTTTFEKSASAEQARRIFTDYIRREVEGHG